MAVEPFLGEIMMFAGNFPPRGWVFCEGQLLPIAQHSDLFILLGTIYGGDGRATFALPDLRGRVPIQQGNAPSLFPYSLGQRGGQEYVILSPNEIPSHSHSITPTGSGGGSGGSSTANLRVFQGSGDTDDPSKATGIASQIGSGKTAQDLLSTGADKTISGATIGISTGSGGGNLPSKTNDTGGSQAHENRMPFLALNFCIALEGVFPPRS